ncbi:MAG: DUF3127 domain-containing protein [Bacteroidetes bacterium]|nr:DUF3127 domain-containing protein [Bacteroidota bacterium]
MDITGKVIKALQLQSGQGKNGVWKKQDYILELPSEKFPKKVCITIWGDNIEKFKISEGQTITASIDIESREFNGRWYTDVKAWKVSSGDMPVSQENQEVYYPENSSKEKDDLPF